MTQPQAHTSAQLQTVAAAGLAQLHELIGIVKQLFALPGYSELSDTTVQRYAALQQQYLTAAGSLRSTIIQCFALLESLEGSRQDALQHGEPAQVSSGNGAGGEAQQAEEDPASRRARLQEQLSAKNELVKELIDQLRQMLESMCMWEAHKYQLDRHKEAEGYV